MNAYPFSVYKRADRTTYSVRFKDEQGHYLPAVSTGMKTKKEAMQAAFLMLRDGIPQKQETVTVQALELKDAARRIKTPEEAGVFLAELKRLGMVKSYVLKDTGGAEELLAFLDRFWDYENSPYVQEKKRKQHGIHKRYCLGQRQTVARHWAAHFKGRLLGEITSKELGEFVNRIGELRLSHSRKNLIVLAGTVPLRWAYAKGLTEIDCTRGLLMFAGAAPKRSILTPARAGALFNAAWSNERAKLGNMLAAITGMRCGEIQALRGQDLGTDCIHVRASWNLIDGLKTTKNNEARTVEVPFPEIMCALRELAARNPWGAAPDSYVFWSEYSFDKPMNGKRFLNAMREALAQTGDAAESAGAFVFHAWRHFYATYMTGKVDAKLLKTQTGHKTDDMLAHYADHEADGDRALIQSAQRKTFGAMLPRLAPKDGAQESAAETA